MSFPRSTGIALLGAIGLCSPLRAQSLQEIVVTSTREPARLIEVDANLGVVDQRDIALVGPTHHSETFNRVAGVMIQRGSGQESLTAIRSPVLTGPGACGAFLVVEDGLPIRPVGACNVNELFEIDTEQARAIEILRGPGPAYYGASAVHGIVNVRTPSVAELPPIGLTLRGGPSSYLQGLVGGRLDAGTAQLGAQGLYAHDGGWRDDSGYDEGKLVLSADVPQLAGGALRVRASGTVLNQETAGFIEGYEAYRDRALARTNPNPEAYRDAWSARLSSIWTRESCAGCYTDARFIVRKSSMDFLQHFLLGTPVEVNGQTSALFSWSTRRPWGERLQVGGGIDLETSSAWLRQFQTAPTTGGSPAANAIRPQGYHYDYRVDGTTAGVFGTLAFDLTPQWRLDAALRAETTRYDYDNRMIDGNTDANGVPCGAGGCLYSRPADRTDRFDNLAPKATVSWQPIDDQRFYAAWSLGFRPPEQTELYRLQRQQQAAQLDPERMRGVELGWRGAFEQFDASLAAFAFDKDNVILRDSAGFNVNGGATSHEGVEYEVTWRFAPTWQVALAGTHARHRYEFNAQVEGGESIRSGNDIDTAPRHLNTLRLGWSPSAAFSAELEWMQVGRYWLDAANLHEYDGHGLANLRARWALASGWSFAARVTNLFDEAYADRADYAFGQYRYFPGRGRAAFVEVAWRAAP